MRLRSAHLCFAVLVFTASLHAQQYTQKIDVSIVNVDVTVTSHGQPVRGLTRDDFEVLEDGRPQAITNFYAVENHPTAIASDGSTAAPAPADAVASGATDERFRRKVLVIVDNMHTSIINRNRALERLEKFIDDHFEGGEYDWSIAVAGSRLQLVLPLTSDKASIHTAINAIRKAGTWRSYRDALIAVEATKTAQPNNFQNSAFSTFADVDLNDQVAFVTSADAMEDTMMSIRTMAAIREATRSFASASGRKIILLLSSGLGAAGNAPVESLRSGPVVDGRQLKGYVIGDPRTTLSNAAASLNGLRDAIIHEANASNVSLYIINPEGLVPAGDVDSEFAPRPSDNGQLYWLARQTGGQFMPGNRPELSLKQFDNASANFYSLAYRPNHGDDSAYHRITVRLKGKRDAELRYREGYASLSQDVQVVRSLLSPISPTMHTASIALTASAGDSRKEKGGVLVPIEARVPLKDLQFVPEGAGNAWRAHVEFYVSIFDRNGANLELKRFSTTANSPDGNPSAGELSYNASVHLASGKPHTIVVAVRDLASDSLGMWRYIVPAGENK